MQTDCLSKFNGENDTFWRKTTKTHKIRNYINILNSHKQRGRAETNKRNSRSKDICGKSYGKYVYELIQNALNSHFLLLPQ